MHAQFGVLPIAVFNSITMPALNQKGYIYNLMGDVFSRSRSGMEMKPILV